MRTESQGTRGEKPWCPHAAFPETEVVESWANRGNTRAAVQGSLLERKFTWATSAVWGAQRRFSMRFHKSEEVTELHLSKIQVNYKLSRKQPLHLFSGLYFYIDKFTCIYSTWYVDNFDISSMSSVKDPWWVLSGSGGVLSSAWPVCTHLYRIRRLGPLWLLPQRTNSENSLCFFTVILSFPCTVFMPRMPIAIIDTLVGPFFSEVLEKGYRTSFDPCISLLLQLLFHPC